MYSLKKNKIQLGMFKGQQKSKIYRFYLGGWGDNPGNKDGEDAEISRIKHKEGRKKVSGTTWVFAA